MEFNKQRTIEFFFKKHKVNEQKLKVILLPRVTDLVYEYNVVIVKYGQVEDEYKKKQLQVDIEYIEEKIAKIIKEVI